MLRTVKRILIIAAVATTGVAASAGTAHASTVERLVSAAGPAAVTQPTTNIEGKGSALKWSPKSVKALPAAAPCGSSSYSFLILNKTKATQQVEYSGGPLGPPIPPKHGLYVCASGKIKTTFWVLADPNAKLKVNVT